MILENDAILLGFDFFWIDSRYFLEILNGLEVAVLSAVLNYGCGLRPAQRQSTLQFNGASLVHIDLGHFFGRIILYQVFEDRVQFLVATFRAESDHLVHRSAPAIAILAFGNRALYFVTAFADLLCFRLAGTIRQLHHSESCEN